MNNLVDLSRFVTLHMTQHNRINWCYKNIQCCTFNYRLNSMA